eukprot:gnl/TRDRNA2_/TRDRNA2_125569_c0_seq1.p1 gnl/TRDRNA2_/TRDRNA2_125569_c0~~gnl/TRDRNA2_/TRDRNA2_125569_c0_seq1.p1  ORF type:complete len:538 (-),score=54.79 gnl/TRDRNA2_/TRDRNA2_125569_c0_seq1:108-1721(-)
MSSEPQKRRARGKRFPSGVLPQGEPKSYGPGLRSPSGNFSHIRYKSYEYTESEHEDDVDRARSALRDERDRGRSFSPLPEATPERQEADPQTSVWIQTSRSNGSTRDGWAPLIETASEGDTRRMLRDMFVSHTKEQMQRQETQMQRQEHVLGQRMQRQEDILGQRMQRQEDILGQRMQRQEDKLTRLVGRVDTLEASKPPSGQEGSFGVDPVLAALRRYWNSAYENDLNPRPGSQEKESKEEGKAEAGRKESKNEVHAQRQEVNAVKMTQKDELRRRKVSFPLGEQDPGSVCSSHQEPGDAESSDDTEDLGTITMDDWHDMLENGVSYEDIQRRKESDETAHRSSRLRSRSQSASRVGDYASIDREEDSRRGSHSSIEKADQRVKIVALDLDIAEECEGPKWCFGPAGAKLRKFTEDATEVVRQKLSVGDRLISINGQNVEGLPQAEITRIWKAAQKDSDYLYLKVISAQKGNCEPTDRRASRDISEDRRHSREDRSLSREDDAGRARSASRAEMDRGRSFSLERGRVGRARSHSRS